LPDARDRPVRGTRVRRRKLLSSRCQVAALLWLVCAVATSWIADAAAVERPRGQALQFRITNYLTLDEFEGATLAYQRSLSSELALRLSVDLGLQRDTGDVSYEYSNDEDGAYSDEEFSRQYSVAVSVQWLRYRGEEVALYFGGGPRVSYSLWEFTDWGYYTWGTQKVESCQTTYELGLEGCIGVQWAATEWLAVHAEYVTMLTYWHSEAEEERWRFEEWEDPEEYRISTSSVDGVSLDSTGVRFGISIYF